MKSFLRLYSGCKTAEEYWNKRINNGDCIYHNKLDSNNQFDNKLSIYEEELAKHNIKFHIIDWQSSYETPAADLTLVAKKQIVEKYGEEASFVYTTENDLYTAKLGEGLLLLHGYFNNPTDAIHMVNTHYRQFKDMFAWSSADIIELTDTSTCTLAFIKVD